MSIMYDTARCLVGTDVLYVLAVDSTPIFRQLHKLLGLDKPKFLAGADVYGNEQVTEIRRGEV